MILGLLQVLVLQFGRQWRPEPRGVGRQRGKRAAHGPQHGQTGEYPVGTGLTARVTKRAS